MPAIRSFEAPAADLRPTGLGVSAAVQTGRAVDESLSSVGQRVGSAIKAAGDVAVAYEDHRQISQGAAEAAKTLDGLTNEWNQRAKTADPNDPSVAGKFRDQVLEPALEKLRGGFTTERSEAWAESHIEQMRNHLYAKTAADMSTLAGIAAKQNVETLTNQLTNTVFTDPSSLKASLSLAESSIGAMVDSSPNLRGVDAAKVREDLLQNSKAMIVKSAALAAINRNPDAGLKQFSSSEYSKYISGTELQQLTQQAKTVQSAMRTDALRQQTMQREIKEQVSLQTEGEYFAKLHSGNPDVAASVTAKDVASDFRLSVPARQRMVGIIQRETQPETATRVSNETANDLLTRIRKPVGDPERVNNLDAVYSAYEKGRLNKSDLKFLREEFTNVRTPEGEAINGTLNDFLKSVKPLIDKSNPLMGKIDATGSQKAYEFSFFVSRKIDEYKKAGKDPFDLFNPSKPDYLGNPAALQPYQKTLQESLGDTAAKLSGKPAARNDVMPSIPPPEQRPPGLYETPKGTMKWTGTGWVKP